MIRRLRNRRAVPEAAPEQPTVPASSQARTEPAAIPPAPRDRLFQVGGPRAGQAQDIEVKDRGRVPGAGGPAGRARRPGHDYPPARGGRFARGTAHEPGSLTGNRDR